MWPETERARASVVSLTAPAAKCRVRRALDSKREKLAAHNNMGIAVDPPIPANLVEWIAQQAIFFHATAPLEPSHHINLSPKSASQFRVLEGARQVAYLDLTGSGNETAAHLIQNPRITIMFVALKGPPRTLRLFGNARYLIKGACPAALLELFDQVDRDDPGFRGVVLQDVTRISTSCGYSIPIYDCDPVPRNTLRDKMCGMGQRALDDYRREKNCLSIDLLPGYQTLVTPELVPQRVEIKNGFPLTYDYAVAVAVAKQKKPRSLLVGADAVLAFAAGVAVGVTVAACAAAALVVARR